MICTLMRSHYFIRINRIENVSTSKTVVTKALGELNLNINNVIPHFIFATAGYHGIGS